MSFFHKTHSIGIDISDSSIEVLELTKNSEVVRYARLFLPTGIVHDGKILDKHKLAEKLKELLQSAQPRPFPRGDALIPAALSLPESQTFIQIFTVDEHLSGQELREHILSEAEKIIPFESKDLFWDFIEKPKPLRKRTEDDGGQKPMKQILYAGTLKSVLEEYRNTLRLAGIQATVVEAESIAVARALLGQDYFKTLAWENDKTPSSAMILDIGARITVASIFGSGGFLEFSILVPLGGDHFRETIQKKFNISEVEAEELKRDIGFDYQRPDKDASIIVLQLQADLQKILTELQKSIDYHERKSGEKVAEIILAGGSALVPKIDEYLALNLDRTVTIGDPFKNIRNPALFGGGDEAILFSNVIGLALRGGGVFGINLLSEEKRNLLTLFMKQKKGIGVTQKNNKREKKFTKTLLFGIVFLLLAIILGIMMYRNIPQLEDTLVYELEDNQKTVSESSIENPISIESQAENGTDEGEPDVNISEDLSTDVILIENQENGILNKVETEIVVQVTPTGWLNVREGPGIEYPVLLRIYPSERYTLIEEKDSWYKIELVSAMHGWVSSKYTEKTKEE